MRCLVCYCSLISETDSRSASFIRLSIKGIVSSVLLPRLTVFLAGRYSTTLDAAFSGHPDAEITGRPVPPPKKFFPPFGPHFGLNIRGAPGPPGPSPGFVIARNISVFSKGPWAFLYDGDSISFLITSRNLAMEYHFIQREGSNTKDRTNIKHKGLQRTANEYAEERRIYKELISKNNNVDILNSASRILQC